MKGVFVVTEISEGRIMVSPYQENIFSSGKSVLSRIEVMNPKHFNVEKGTKVSIGFSKGLENVQGICSLVFPVLCCALGLFLYPKAVSAFGMEYSEIARFIFGGSYVSVCICSRNKTYALLLHGYYTANYGALLIFARIFKLYFFTVIVSGGT